MRLQYFHNDYFVLATKEHYRQLANLTPSTLPCSVPSFKAACAPTITALVREHVGEAHFTSEVDIGNWHALPIRSTTFLSTLPNFKLESEVCHEMSTLLFPEATMAMSMLEVPELNSSFPDIRIRE